MFTHKHLYTLLILLSVLTVVSCRQDDYSQMICHNSQLLSSISNRRFTLGDYEEWIGENLILSKKTEFQIDTIDGKTRIRWQAGKVMYSSWLIDGQVTDLYLKPEEEVTAMQLINCIGQPEYYRIYYGRYTTSAGEYTVDLYYPRQGINLHGYIGFKTGKYPVQHDVSQIPITNISFVQPTQSLNQFLHDVYGAMLRSVDVTEIAPWPGNWDDVVIHLDH